MLKILGDNNIFINNFGFIHRVTPVLASLYIVYNICGYLGTDNQDTAGMYEGHLNDFYNKIIDNSLKDLSEKVPYTELEVDMVDNYFTNSMGMFSLYDSNKEDIHTAKTLLDKLQNEKYFYMSLDGTDTTDIFDIYMSYGIEGMEWWKRRVDNILMNKPFPKELKKDNSDRYFEFLTKMFE